MHSPNSCHRRPRRLALLTSLLLFAALLPAGADIIEFDLLGKAGPGLLPGNENGTIVGDPGSGGEIGQGIFFDNVSLQLTINVGWGSGHGMGFEDLSGPANNGHIHGPTASAPPASFNENAGVLIGLDSLAGYNSSATNGGFSGTVSLTSAQATALTEGRLYLNFHTPTNSGGEIRGNMVVVPEPTSLGLVAIGAAALFLARRRKRCS